jgi:hypothetical protein
MLLAFACLTAAAPMLSFAKPSLPPLFGVRGPPPAMVFEYHGWRVDASAAVHAQNPDQTVRMVKDQLELVETAGLKPSILAVMRATPIVVVPGTGPEPAVYSRARGVSVYARRLDKSRPILLRALLAAYFDRALPQSAAIDVNHYRREILAKRLWPKSAAMLQTDRDYFAITSAAYLYGAITREPYNRANLRKTQPDYYQWLARLFDDGRGRT